MKNLDLTLTDISKIEGKASCSVKMTNGKVDYVRFSIAEYKRFYTKAIIGKDLQALPQLTSRICGTCSNAHLLCAIKAVEKAVGLKVSGQTKLLRMLLNFGLMIRDHALHLYIFVLPDLLGKDSILDFDENNKVEYELLSDAFEIKAAGNYLSKITGGRSVHAPFAAVGGFTRLPVKEDLVKARDALIKIRPKVLRIIDFFAKKDGVLFADNLDFAAISDEKYSFLEGDLIRSDGSVVPEENYGSFLEKTEIPYSHASGYKFSGNVYMVGALARVNLAKDKLHSRTKMDAGIYLENFPSANIFHNNLAQAIEILHSIDYSVDILENIKITDEKPLPVIKKEGSACAVIEAPRGALYYEIGLDKNGKITRGKIVVPTGQNQISIEEAIKQYLENNLSGLTDREKAEEQIERIVRAYDPCMSCASHFIKFRWT